MRALDEWMALYAGRDPLARKYLLAAMGARPVGPWSQDLVELLWGESSDTETRVRHQARRELGRVLPRFLRRSYGLDASGGSLWTGYQAPGRSPSMDDSSDLEAWSATDAPAIAAGFQLLVPAIDKAMELLDAPSHTVRQIASLVVGRSPLRRMALGLAGPVGAGDAPFHSVAALAEMGTATAHAQITSAAQAWGLGNSDVVSLLAAVPPSRVVALLETLAARTDSYGRANIALALVHNRSDAGRAILLRLIERKEGWVTAHALEAVRAHGRPDDLKLVALALDPSSPEFLRVLATQVAGHVPGPEALDLLTSLTRDGSVRVQVAALEGLVRRRQAPSELASIADVLVGSPLLKARVVAAQVMSQVDPDKTAAIAEDLLFADEPLGRLEGAYLLGYLAGGDSVAALDEVAGSDPVAEVRLQAVQSLGRQPPELAVDRLAALLNHEDAGVARNAARCLAQVPADALPAALDALVVACREAQRPAVRAVCLRALGAGAARLPGFPTPAVLAEAIASPNAGDVYGALEGLKLVGAPGLGTQLKTFLNHPDPRIKGAACVGAFWAGESQSVEGLCQLMGASHEESVHAGLSAVLELVSVMPGLVVTRRFAKLTAWLEARAGQPSSQAFATAQLEAVNVEDQPDGSLEGDEDAARAKAPPRLRDTARRLRNLYGRGDAAEGVGATSRRIDQTGRRTLKDDLAGLNVLARVEELDSAQQSAASRHKGRKAFQMGVAFGLAVVILVGLGVRSRRVDPTSVSASASSSDASPGSVAQAMPVFRVDFVAGTVEVEGGGLLEVGSSCPSGRLIRLSEGAKLSLRHRDLAVVWLEGAGSLRLGSSLATPAWPPRPWFTDVAGRVTFDVRRVPAVPLILGPRRAVALHALLRLAPGTHGSRLIVEEGRVELSGTKVPVVGAGQSVDLDD